MIILKLSYNSTGLGMKNKNFDQRNTKKINQMYKDKNFQLKSKEWIEAGYDYEYSYHFKWLGRPIIQYPQDIVAIQEIIWNVKPDLIIETGVAHGGSLILSASILELIGHGEVLGVDIDIRKHNKKEIENHKLFKRINLIEGSSINKKIIDKVSKFVKNKKKIMVFLDSNHTYSHVKKELIIYSNFVTKGSYLIVFDTIIADISKTFFKNRIWNSKNNPKIAVNEFLASTGRFKIDKKIENKLGITASPHGYLKCVSNN